jgi:hypothetical protein
VDSRGEISGEVGKIIGARKCEDPVLKSKGAIREDRPIHCFKPGGCLFEGDREKQKQEEMKKKVEGKKEEKEEVEKKESEDKKDGEKKEEDKKEGEKKEENKTEEEPSDKKEESKTSLLELHQGAGEKVHSAAISGKFLTLESSDIQSSLLETSTSVSTADSTSKEESPVASGVFAIKSGDVFRFSKLLDIAGIDLDGEADFNKSGEPQRESGTILEVRS